MIFKRDGGRAVQGTSRESNGPRGGWHTGDPHFMHSANVVRLVRRAGVLANDKAGCARDEQVLTQRGRVVRVWEGSSFEFEPGYRVTSLMRNCILLGLYSRPMPRALWQPLGRLRTRRDELLQRFRGGLIFKAHRHVYHSTLGSRVVKKKGPGGGQTWWLRTGVPRS